MKRLLLVAALFFSTASAYAAVTSLQWGVDRTTSPWTTCVYDANNVCQGVFTVPATGGGALVPSARGGTGVNNGANTFTIGGNIAFSGAFTFTGTLTGATAVTFPTSGTLAITTTPAASIVVGSTAITGGTPNGLLWNSAGNLGNLSTVNNGVLVTSSGGAPSISTTLPAALTIPTAMLTGLTTTGNITSTSTPAFSGLFTGATVNANTYISVTATSATIPEIAGVFRLNTTIGAPNYNSAFKQSLGFETIAGAGSASAWGMAGDLTTNSGFPTGSASQITAEFDQGNFSGIPCTDVDYGVSGAGCMTVLATGGGPNKISTAFGIEGSNQYLNGLTIYSAGAVSNSIKDYSQSQVSYKDVGQHINGWDGSGATYSGNYLAGPGADFLVSGAGAITGLNLTLNSFTVAGVVTNNASGVFASIAKLTVALGGTNCAAASGTCLDNITAFSSTGFVKRTGAGTYTFTTDPSDVTSVFTRTGAVTAQSGDYAVAQVTGAAPTASPSFTGSATITSASATAFSVGLNGATNPSFVVNDATALQVAGLSVTGAVTGGTVALAAIDSGAASNLTINAKGTGTIGIGTVSTGLITLTRATTASATLGVGGALIGANAFSVVGATYLRTATNFDLVISNQSTVIGLNAQNDAGGANVPLTIFSSAIMLNGPTTFTAVLASTGSAPTCGTGCASVSGSSTKFAVTSGTAVTSVTVNFAVSYYASAPVCTIGSGSTASVVDISSISASAITLGASVALTTSVINVICVQ